MKVLSGLVVIGAVVTAVPFSSRALGADLPVKVQAIGGVIYYGDIEIGGLGFIERPANQIRATTIPVTGTGIPVTGFPTTAWNYSRPESRAKFEEYGNVIPFLFDHIYLGAATADGRYYTNFYATNIGNNNQSYSLDLAETGRQYLTLSWDQIPHLYSTTAQSIYGGSSTVLTAPNLSATCPSTGVTTNATATACATAINANLHTINLGIQRDKATIEYRTTLTESSEFNVEYSHERRWGTQETGITSGTSAGGIGPAGTAMAVPMPIADTTQDARASYQYSGISPWGKKFNVIAQYSASIYQNDDQSFTIQNPFLTPALGNLTPGYLNQFSLAPNNNAQSFNGTIGADLAWKSRYMGTFSYTMMRQNEPFMAQTSSANIFNFGGITSAALIPAPSRGSLDGAINTMLINNVVTTQLTPDLKSKLSYRYYNYDNATSPLLMQQWVIGDTASACISSQSYCPHVTQFTSYVKQNAGADLNWRANSWLNTGIGYGWERYQWSLANASATNENSGKIFADARPTDWLTVRTSYQYLSRKADNYNYFNNVWTTITNNFAGCIPSTTAVLGTCAGGGGIQINPLMRIFNLSDRDRQKANVYIDFDVAPGIVITPTFGMRYDNYPVGALAIPVPPNPAASGGTANTIGLQKDDNYNVGVELSMRMTESIMFVGSYMHENISRRFNWATGNTNFPPAALANYDTVNIRDYVDTFSAAVNIQLMPAVLDLRLGYTYSHAAETGAGVTCASSFACSTAANLSIANSVPNVTSTYQLFESTLKYKLDQNQLRAVGWSGQGYAKLRYAYESYQVSNWQSDNMMPFMYAVAPTATSGGNKVWLAGDSPNYRAQLIMATLGLTW